MLQHIDINQKNLVKIIGYHKWELQYEYHIARRRDNKVMIL
jgi:hypothetical protein